MNAVLSLLKIRLLTFINKGRNKKRWVKICVFAGVGGLLWIGIFQVTLRVLTYIKSIADIGDILALKLLSMIILTFFSLLIFSSILTSLSKLFLSRDLHLVHALPIRHENIFLARWIESTLDSSWMVIVYTIPVLISYGVAFRTGPFFYANIFLTLLPLCIIASGLSALTVMVVVIILPASRIRSIFVFLGLAMFVVLYVAFRLLKPERLVDPETFANTMLYLQSLRTPSSPFLPSTWIFDSLSASLKNDISGSLFHLAISWSGSLFFGFVNLYAAKLIYFKGFSKSQISAVKFFKDRKDRLSRIFSFFPGPTRAFLVKEIRTFWRDQTQWTQIFLIGALVAIYVYNFYVLPLEKSPIETVYLQNLFSFLNMALAAFVMTAVTARFVFPCISIEGNAFWLVKSSPISIRSFLLIKLFIYLWPLLLLAQMLIITTNLLLKVTPFMMVLSSFTLLFITPGVVSIGIGLGAAYPDFSAENPNQAVTGFGGLVFMLCSAVFIGAVIIIEAGPVYALFMSQLKNYPLSFWQWAWIIGSFIVNIIICVFVTISFFKFGENRLRVHLPLQAHRSPIDEIERV
jgi:ABC-2 type transport system permease protein